MLTPTLIAALLFNATGAPQLSQRASAQSFLRAIPDSAPLVNGQAFEYRYRQLEFGEAATGDAPELAIEGVTRLEYRDSGVFTNELFLEDSPRDDSFGTAYRRRTFHSFLTGEYARASSLAGATDSVIIERWRGLPKLTYLALGLLGPPDSLRSAEFRGTRSRNDGLQESEYLVEGGKTLTLLFDPAPPGRLLRAESRPPNDAWTAVRYFEDHVPGVGDLPARPTRIVDAKVASTGRVVRVTVWQAVERLDRPEIDDDLVDKGAMVASLRLGEQQRWDGKTDRPMRLEELLTGFAGSTQALDALPTGDSQNSHAAMGASSSAPDTRFGNELPLIGIILAIGLIVAAITNRKRILKAC